MALLSAPFALEVRTRPPRHGNKPHRGPAWDAADPSGVRTYNVRLRGKVNNESVVILAKAKATSETEIRWTQMPPSVEVNGLGIESVKPEDRSEVP